MRIWSLNHLGYSSNLSALHSRGRLDCALLTLPQNVFMLPDMARDWRFENSPYVESGGLRAYAGAPLRLQNEVGDTVCLGSICVASTTQCEPLTRAQQTTLVRLADWIVADIVQLTRARRQRERRRMVDMLAAAQEEANAAVSEEPITRILQTAYPEAVISLQTCKAGHVELNGQDLVSLSDFYSHVWEDTEYIDNFIAKSNHLQLPVDRVVRAIAAPCESVSGQSYLIVGSKDFQLIFDDIDEWFVQACADVISQMWHKRLLGEVMVAKEKFLRGFSHQLRTPVHGILGSVELLAEELKAGQLDKTISKTVGLLQTSSTIAKSEDDHRVYLDTIKRAGRDLISIINSMITLNRWADVAITNRQYTTYTIHELEADLTAQVQNVICGDTRYNASVFFNHNNPSRCSFRTDPSLLRDSLFPVILNAIQNTPEGLVTIFISVCPDSKELIVDINDTGHGIPPNDHQRIFELYEQVDVYSTGAGLGLTLATRFAALLKGSIDLVWSECNRGSHFRATFKDVEVNHPESPPRPELSITPSANLPRSYHVVPCSSDALCLSDHFAKCLACYDFTASDHMEDALIIAEYVDDPEQHRAAISQIPSNRVVLCPVPFSEKEARLDATPTNVIYVFGPFDAQSLSSALERAGKIITLLDEAPKPQITENLVLLSGPSDRTNSGRNETEGVSGDGMQAAVSPVNGSQPCQPHQIENASTVDPLPTMEAQLHTPPAEESTATFEILNSANTTVRTGPVIAHQPEDSEQLCISADHSSVSHPTALLVDDNAINLRVMQMYCKKRGLQYLCARDGLEAISVFQHRQESAAIEKKESPIQLVLMDLQMPTCDGIEATQRIRQLEQERGWGKSVVFIVTGQDSPADRKAAHNAGSQEYHVKPVSLVTLDTGVKQYFPSFQSCSKSSR